MNSDPGFGDGFTIGGGVQYATHGPSKINGNSGAVYVYSGLQFVEFAPGHSLWLAGHYLNLEGTQSGAGAKAFYVGPVFNWSWLKIVAGGGAIDGLAVKLGAGEKGASEVVGNELGWEFDLGLLVYPNEVLYVGLGYVTLGRGDLGRDDMFHLVTGLYFGK